jgi:hypothetical protein
MRALGTARRLADRGRGVIATARDIHPLRDLAIIFGAILGMPIAVLLIVAVGAACDSLLDYISRRTRSILMRASSASTDSATESRDSR